MRILLVNWNDRENPQAGGAEIHLHELFGRIATWGHEVQLITSGWRGCARRSVVDGIHVQRVGGRHRFALQARGAVRRALAERSYDVVIEDINKLPLFLPTLTHLPFVAIVPHLFGSTAFAEASSPMAAIVWAAELPIPRVYRNAAFHAISESTRDDLVRRGVPAQRIVVIHPGVDTERYRPDSATPRATRPTFLYLGRLKRYKGVEFALRALALARNANLDIALDICGQGDDRPRLERLTRGLGLEQAVRFLGFVSEAEKQRLLRQAWAVVFPSPKEGWGITNVEAAASGTPAIASNSPGLRESVRDGVTGFLVPHGDIPELGARLAEFASRPDLVAQLGRAARQFAEGLSWESAARATLVHIERTIAERERRT